MRVASVDLHAARIAKAACVVGAGARRAADHRFRLGLHVGKGAQAPVLRVDKAKAAGFGACIRAVAAHLDLGKAAQSFVVVCAVDGVAEQFAHRFFLLFSDQTETVSAHGRILYDEQFIMNN